MALTWYLRTFGANANDPGSYTSVGTTPPECPGTGKICAIYADDDGFGDPDITPALLAQMNTALSSGVDQPRVILRVAD